MRKKGYFLMLNQILNFNILIGAISMDFLIRQKIIELGLLI